MIYTIELAGRGVLEEITIDAVDDEQADRKSRKAARQWAEGGEWGDGGARVIVYYTIYASVSESESEAEEIDSGSIEVEIEPHHSKLIESACDHASRERLCGVDPDDHDWSSIGEGGCDDNPGVWITGGTSLEFREHCEMCGLQRERWVTGSQANPGEHDTVAYTMPDFWCSAHQSDDRDHDACIGENQEEE